METSRTILVVDDERAILELFASCIGPDAPPLRNCAGGGRDLHDHRLLLAASCEEAAGLVERERLADRRVAGGFFDLALKDGPDGLETIRRVRSIDPLLLCTVVTGRRDRSVDDIHEYFLPDHADEWDYLAKPFTPWEIRQKCRQMIASWNRRRREATHLEEIQRLHRQLQERNAALEQRELERRRELELALRELGKARTARADERREVPRRPAGRVSAETLDAIRVLLASGRSRREIADALRLHRSTVYKVAPVGDSRDPFDLSLLGSSGHR